MSFLQIRSKCFSLIQSLLSDRQFNLLPPSPSTPPSIYVLLVLSFSPCLLILIIVLILSSFRLSFCVCPTGLRNYTADGFRLTAATTFNSSGSSSLSTSAAAAAATSPLEIHFFEVAMVRHRPPIPHIHPARY